MLDQKNTFKRILFTSTIILGTLTTIGCTQTTGIRGSSETGKKLVDSGNAIKDSSEAIINSTKTIDKSTTQIEQNSDIITEKSQDPEIRDLVNDVKQNNNTIRSESERIASEANRIKSESGIVVSGGNSVDGLEADLKEAQEEESKAAKKKLFQMLAGMFAVGGLIIIAGVALAFFNPKLGAYLVGFGLVVTAIAVAGTYYLKWIAIIGFIVIGLGLLTTLGFLIHSFWKARIYKESHESNIKIIEEVKNDLLPEEKEKLFGDNGIATKIQPKRVQKEIKKTRKSMKFIQNEKDTTDK